MGGFETGRIVLDCFRWDGYSDENVTLLWDSAVIPTSLVGEEVRVIGTMLCSQTMGLCGKQSRISLLYSCVYAPD